MTAPWATAHVDAVLDWSHIDDELVRRLERSTRTATRAAQSNFDKLERGSQRSFERMESGFSRQMDRMRAKSARPIEVKVEVDRKATSDLNALERQLVRARQAAELQNARVAASETRLQRVRASGDTEKIARAELALTSARNAAGAATDRLAVLDERRTDRLRRYRAELDKLAASEAALTRSRLAKEQEKLEGGFRRLASGAAGAILTVGKFAGIAGAATLAVGSLVPVVGALGAGIAAVGVAAGGAGVAGLLALGGVAATMKVAFSGMGDALKNAFDPENADKYQQALAKLDPSARSVVESVKKIGDQFRSMGIKTAVSEAMFAGLGPQLERLTRFLPAVRDMMVGIAGGFHDGAKNALSFVNSARGMGIVKGILGDASAMGRQFGAALGNIVPGLLAIGRGATQAFRPLTDGLSGASKRLSDFLIQAQQTGRIERFFQRGIDTAKQFGQVLSTAGSILGGVFHAASVAGGGNPLGGILGSLQKVSDWVHSFDGQNALVTFFRSAREAMGAVMPVFTELAGVIGKDVAPIVADLAKTIGPSLVSAVHSLGEAIRGAAPTIHLMGEAFALVLRSVSPLLPVLGPLLPVILGLGAASKLLGGGLGSVGTGLRSLSLLGTLGAGFRTMGTGIQTAGRQLGNFGQQTRTGVGGLNALRGAGMGVMGAFGGPFGLAMTGAVAGISYFVSASQNAAAKQQEYKQAVDASADASKRLREQIISTGDVMSSESLAAAGEQLKAFQAQNNAYSAEGAAHEQGKKQYGAFGGALSDGGRKLLHAFGYSDSYDQEQKDQRYASEALKNINVDQAAAAAARGGNDWANYYNKFLADRQASDDAINASKGPLAAITGKINTSGGTAIAAGQLNQFRDSIQRAQTVAQSSTPAFTSLSGAVAALGDKSLSASQKSQALGAAIDKMNPQRAALLGAAQFTQTLDQARTQIEGLQGVTADFLDVSTTGGSQLAGIMDNIIQGYNGALASGKDMTQQNRQLEQSIQQIASQTGLSVDQVRSRFNELGLGTAKLVEDLAKVKDNAAQQAGVIQAQLTQMGGKPIELSVQASGITDQTIEKLRGMGLQVENFRGAGGEAMIRIGTNADAIVKKLDGLGIKTTSLPTGQVVVSDTSEENIRHLAQIGYATERLPNGQVVIKTDASAFERAAAYISGTPIDATVRLKVTKDAIANAMGSIRAAFFADGGMRQRAKGDLDTAQIQPGRGAGRFQRTPLGPVQWAEGETQWEAFIPGAASKRPRAMAITAEVARRFGYQLIPIGRKMANGGVAGKDFAQSMDPATYQMGGFSRDAIDCSGMVAATINAIDGKNPFESRMSTVNEGEWLAERGFAEGPGKPGDIIVGWFDHGGGANGHTAMTLSDGTNVESNGNEGVVIGGPVGGLDPMFDHVMHRPGLGGDLGGPAGGGGLGGALGGGGGTPIGSGISGGTSWGNSGGGSQANSIGEARGKGLTPVWVENWPSSMGGGGSSYLGGDYSGGSSPLTPAGAAGGGPVPVPTLGGSPSKEEVAAAIYAQAKNRGYSDADAAAITSAGLQESGLDPQAIGGGGAWHGIFQQDESYEGRDDPNKNIDEFFNRLDEKTKADPNADIYKRIFWLQQAPGASSADSAYEGGRQAYLDEIRSHQAEAETLLATARAGSQAQAAADNNSKPQVPVDSNGSVPVTVTDKPLTPTGGAGAATPPLTPKAPAAPAGPAAGGKPSDRMPYGVARANQYLVDNDYAGQFRDVGISAVKSFGGELADEFGLKGLFDTGFDQMVAYLKQIAEQGAPGRVPAPQVLVNNYGTAPVKSEVQQTAGMTAVTQTYRSG